MSAGPIRLHYVEETGDRRAGDRRRLDRRAPRRWIDPLFAATLVNQITPAETQYTHGYSAPPPRPRRGIVMNVKA